MAFLACGGCLKDIFVTEEEIIDRFTGQELWTWGTGTNGVLGDNTVVSKSSPVQTVSGGTYWRSISISNTILVSDKAAGIKTDGTLWLWGRNLCGSLGTDNAVTLARSSPVQTISGGTNWRSVSAQTCHVGALKTDGTLWMWGAANNGRLGNDDVVTLIRSSPVQTISGGTNWKSISLGSDFTGAIKTDGTLWMWGEAGSGRLGNNSTIDRSSPVQTISAGTNWRSISGGSAHSVAVKTDGTLWTWGSGLTGALGQNLTTSRSSPVQTVITGSVWRSGAAGNYMSAAVKTDGTLWLWGGSSFGSGADSYGSLGDDANVNRSSPVQTISGGTNWRSVAVSNLLSAGIKTDGTLWLWGCGGSGGLGGNATLNVRSPVQTITGGTNWRLVSTGGNRAAATRLTEY